VACSVQTTPPATSGIGQDYIADSPPAICDGNLGNWYDGAVHATIEEGIVTVTVLGMARSARDSLFITHEGEMLLQVNVVTSCSDMAGAQLLEFSFPSVGGDLWLEVVGLNQHGECPVIDRRRLKRVKISIQT